MEIVTVGWDEAVQELRQEILCDDAADDLEYRAATITLTPMAEQYHLLALAALEQAQRYLKLSHYFAMRGD